MRPPIIDMSIGFRRLARKYVIGHLKKTIRWSEERQPKSAKNSDCGSGLVLQLEEIGNHVQFGRKVIHRLVEVTIDGLEGTRRLARWVWVR